MFVNDMTEMQELIAKSLRDFKEGSIVKGRILEIRPEKFWSTSDTSPKA